MSRRTPVAAPAACADPGFRARPPTATQLLERNIARLRPEPQGVSA